MKDTLDKPPKPNRTTKTKPTTPTSRSTMTSKPHRTLNPTLTSETHKNRRRQRSESDIESDTISGKRLKQCWASSFRPRSKSPDHISSSSQNSNSFKLLFAEGIQEDHGGIQRRAEDCCPPMLSMDMPSHLKSLRDKGVTIWREDEAGEEICAETGCV